jgi:small multidrug resistance family-3 protein
MDLNRMDMVERLAANPYGALFLIAVAASLEALGDSYFQTGVHRSQGWARLAAFVAGAAVLAAYGLVVNTPRWDFGRLIGVYVAVFFLMAQVLNRVRFGQTPGAPVYAGGALIVAGSLVMALWRG